jgi:hypothetical protein
MTRSRLFLALLLCLSLLAAPSFAAVKPGAKCTKAGKTTTVAGKKFTCIKSGKKLVWNKGVAIKTAPKPELNPVLKPVEPTPTPTSTPTATPTPTPTPTPTTVRVIRYNGPQNADAYDAIQPVYKLLNQVSAELAERGQRAGKASIALLSDEPNNPLVTSTKAVVIKTTEMMRAIDTNFLDNEVYLFRNISWLKSSSLSTKCPHLIKNQEMFGWANAGCDKYWVGDFAFYDDPKNYIGKPRHTPTTLLGLTGSHETVHLIQIGNRLGYSSKFPAWYREGSATVGAGLVMVAMADYANGDYNAVDDWELNSWSKPRCGAVFNTWKEKHDESGHAAMKNCEYSVGRRMVEYLVARDKSFDNIFKVYSAVGPNMTFNEAFEKYHGLKMNDFCALVEPWLDKVGWDTAVTY